MPNINLPTGKTIYLSTYEFYFVLDEKDMDEFYQSCMADDLGICIDDPFSGRVSQGKLEVEEIPEEEEKTIDYTVDFF